VISSLPDKALHTVGLQCVCQKIFTVTMLLFYWQNLRFLIICNCVSGTTQTEDGSRVTPETSCVLGIAETIDSVKINKEVMCQPLSVQDCVVMYSDTSANE
jgi:hypothetical protein